MTKVVINKQHGGFSLSHQAILRYAEIKDLTLFPEPNNFGTITYWTVPIHQRPDTSDFYSRSLEERAALNRRTSECQLFSCYFSRDDPVLVRVVEELGAEADGDYARLAVIEIPDDVEWEIEEYDGLEWVAEAHRTWG